MLTWLRRIRAITQVVPDVKLLIELWNGKDGQEPIRRQAMAALKTDPEVKEFIETFDHVADHLKDLI